MLYSRKKNIKKGGQEKLWPLTSRQFHKKAKIWRKKAKNTNSSHLNDLYPKANM